CDPGEALRRAGALRDHRGRYAESGRAHLEVREPGRTRAEARRPDGGPRVSGLLEEEPRARCASAPGMPDPQVDVVLAAVGRERWLRRSRALASWATPCPILAPRSSTATASPPPRSPRPPASQPS